VPFVLFFEGLARATSGPVQAQFLNKTLVVWVALLAIPLLGERLGLLQLAAVGLLVVGQAALAGGVTALGHLSFGSGEVMILGATGLWAVEVVLAKRLLRELGSWTVALARMVLGSALLVGWVVIRGKGDLLVGMSGRQWGWVLVTGMLLFVYVATWLAALSRAPAVAVTAVLVAAVPVTALLQVLAGQPVPASKMGGLTIIVVGCALAAVAMLRDSRPRTSPAAR
jgi:drug/metabolite transporter (DMT)-like permease